MLALLEESAQAFPVCPQTVAVAVEVEVVVAVVAMAAVVVAAEVGLAEMVVQLRPLS